MVKYPPMAARKPLVFPEADLHCEGWSFSGVLLADEEGFHFFARESSYAGPLLGRLVKESLEVGAGAAGGLLVKLGARAAEGGRERPPRLKGRAREDAAALYDPVLQEHPGLLSCREVLDFPRAGLGPLSLRAGGTLEAGSLAFSGLGERDRLVGALAMRGYPVSKAPTPWPKLAAYGLGLLLAAFGAVAGLLDLYEAHKAGAWLASKEGAQAVVFGGPQGTVVLMQGREVSAKEYRKMAWYDRLPVAKFVLMALFIVMAGVFLAAKRRV